jgi:triacylglycerol lipase
MISTPMYFPDGFDLELAKLCARLSSYAYDMYTQWTKQGKPRKERGFRWTPPSDAGLTFSAPFWSAEEVLWVFNEAEPFGFCARDRAGTGYLVFRRTSSNSDWADDADVDQRPYDLVPNYGQVHDGFLKLYTSMRADVLDELDSVGPISDLRVTGHSLGCGLATLAVPELVGRPGAGSITQYNFASPRVGNPDFAAAYNSNGVPTFRVVNTCDLVPEVPPSVLAKLVFKHVGAPIDFTAQYGAVGGDHSLDGAYRYALDNPGAPQS